jgi:hypothetical protein
MASAEADVSCAGKVYKHQPLDGKEHQIRLLKLHNPSSCTRDYRLITFNYKTAPSYVALSYTWGEERPTGFVSIDGKQLGIRTNLLNFLNTYQTEEYIWIDQICIDQSNIQERSHQVELMHKIYSRCIFVMIWLRDEVIYTPSTKQAALDFNNGISSYLKHGRRENGSSDNEKCLDWPTLALLHNSYFDRLWIVQEVLLSKNVRILVEGNVWVSWESLRTRHEERQDEIRKILPSTSWMVDAQFHRFVLADHTPMSTSYYITTTAGRYYDKKCKDPRDKVYGFMGLVDPSFGLEVDYAKSVQQVYLAAVMSMIREYWYVRRKTPGSEYQLLNVVWPFENSVKSSLRLAQAMASTDLQNSGLRSFVECVWGRVRKHEDTATLLGFEVDAETYCITSLGFELRAHQLSRYTQPTATCDRWWYVFKGKKYYHDCKKWSGNAKLQEYTESRKGARFYGL